VLFRSRSESRALRRKLVEGRRPRRDEYRYAQEVPGGTGTSEAGTALTSTFRTAGCGPACPVVWEGSSGITAAPYPDPAFRRIVSTTSTPLIGDRTSAGERNPAHDGSPGLPPVRHNP